ncbi:hypothetical protein FHT92_002577 [Rhizobium sp. BK377]|nr:hypothetical protein [Rhizobium sp. BK377]
MTNSASDEATLRLNIEALEARLQALDNAPVLRRRLEDALVSMRDRLYEIQFPTLEYDPTQQPDDDDDL